MMFLNAVKVATQYIAEGFLEIFSPHDDQYPAVGIQPFGGTINHRSQFDW